MSSQIKNIIIFISIGAALFLGYFFFFKGDSSNTPNLVSSPNTPSPTGLVNNTVSTGAVGGDFLNLLLSVKSIKLDNEILTSPAFESLQDSSIFLVPDGTEGRPNPFAPLGEDEIATPTDALTQNEEKVLIFEENADIPDLPNIN